MSRSHFISGAAQTVPLGFKPCAVLNSPQCFKTPMNKQINPKPGWVGWCRDSGWFFEDVFLCSSLQQLQVFPVFGAPAHSICLMHIFIHRCRMLIWKEGGGKIHNFSMSKSCPGLSFLLELSLFNH